MNIQETPEPDFERPDPLARRRNLIAGLAVFLGAMLFVAGAIYLAQGARRFALHQWQTRLRASLAESLSKTSAWVEAGHEALTQVTVNATVQIYLSELAAAGYDRKAVPQDETQASFVASYILSAAARGPFAPPDRRDGATGQASPASSGLALLDGKGDLVASSPGFRPPAAFLARFLARKGQGPQKPVVAFVSGTPVLVFFRQVRPLQGGPGSAPIGYVVGARTVDHAFDAILSSPLDSAGGHIALLAQGVDGIGYLHPLSGAKAVASAEAQTLSPASGPAIAAREPGRLIRADDMTGAAALVLAEPVKGSPMVLAASIPEDLALAGVKQREQTLLGGLLLAILAMIASALAFSRHQAGQAASQLAVAAGREAASTARREALMRTVVNAYPGALLLVRPDNTVGFVNARFAGDQGADAGSMQGKPLEAVLPVALREAVAEAFAGQGAPAACQVEFGDSGHRYAAAVVPLSQSVGLHGGALLLVDDITERVRARERRMRIYRGVVDILLEAIDRRDPAAAAHSRRVGTLAREVALMLGREGIEVEAVELAGSLQGANKLFVPGRILRKAGKLSEVEKTVVDDAAQRWLGLLGEISIDLPIAAVLKAAHDLAHGLQSADLDKPTLFAANVVAAANIYVALTSPRAHRQAHSPDDAIGLLGRTMPSLPAEISWALQKLPEARSAVV